MEEARQLKLWSSSALFFRLIRTYIERGRDPKCADLYCVVAVVVLMMERAREMMLLSGVLLYLANSVCSQGTPARSNLVPRLSPRPSVSSERGRGELGTRLNEKCIANEVVVSLWES